eukprot:c45377_g1_i1 orf=55-276(-)
MWCSLPPLQKLIYANYFTEKQRALRPLFHKGKMSKTCDSCPAMLGCMCVCELLEMRAFLNTRRFVLADKHAYF